MAAGADLVCIDLEDAVHPDRKQEARANVLGWLKSRLAAPAGPRVALRLNGLRGAANLDVRVQGLCGSQAATECASIFTFKRSRIA